MFQLIHVNVTLVLREMHTRNTGCIICLINEKLFNDVDILLRHIDFLHAFLHHGNAAMIEDRIAMDMYSVL